MSWLPTTETPGTWLGTEIPPMPTTAYRFSLDQALVSSLCQRVLSLTWSTWMPPPKEMAADTGMMSSSSGGGGGGGDGGASDPQATSCSAVPSSTAVVVV